MSPRCPLFRVFAVLPTMKGRFLCADIDSVGVEILTQSEVTLAFKEGSSSRQLLISVRDNCVYDGGEDRIFAIILSLLYTDFENLNISSDYVEVHITDDEPQPEGICQLNSTLHCKIFEGKIFCEFCTFSANRKGFLNKISGPRNIQRFSFRL